MTVTYELDLGTSVPVTGHGNHPHLLPLDATHSLFWGYPSTGAGGTAMVVDHAVPLAPTVGAPTTFSSTSTDGGNDWDGALSPDGSTVFLVEYVLGSTGVEVAVLSWGGGSSLTAIADTVELNPATVEQYAFVAVPATDRLLIVAGNDFALFDWNGASLSVLDSGTGLASLALGAAWTVDATHVVVLEQDGIELLDLTGDVVSIAATATFASDFPALTEVGLRPTTTDPAVLRGYGRDASGAIVEVTYAVNVGSPSLTPNTGTTYTPSPAPGPAFGIMGPTYDIDGITSFGIDGPNMVVAALSYVSGGSTSWMWPLDHGTNIASDPTVINFAGGSVFGRQRAVNIGNGVLLLTADGGSSDGSVVPLSFVAITPPVVVGGLAWGAVF